MSLALVSAPPARRTCRYCGKPMSAIERWHGCPERRLELGLQRIMIALLEDQKDRRHKLITERHSRRATATS